MRSVNAELGVSIQNSGPLQTGLLTSWVTVLRGMQHSASLHFYYSLRDKTYTLIQVHLYSQTS